MKQPDIQLDLSKYRKLHKTTWGLAVTLGRMLLARDYINYYIES